MKIKLFRAPYVDDEGASRERICAAILNSAEDGFPLEDIDNLAKALEDGKRVLVFEHEDIEVEWL